MTDDSNQAWNGEQYDDKMSFVSKFGQSVIELLAPTRGERILDLGCGTGDLSHRIAQSGAEPTGLDMSGPMIAEARRKYPHIPFLVGDGESFRVEEPFDAVFSNAALHWMKQADRVAESVALALRPGGRFVAEFGGQGNVAAIADAVRAALAACGIDAGPRDPWYFPSVGEYANLLERHGFRVEFAALFDRPTPLADGEAGLATWLDTFGQLYFAGMSPEEKAHAYALAEERARPVLFRDGIWVADYVRIRIKATLR